MTKKEEKLIGELMKTPKKEWKKLSPCAPWHGRAYELEKGGYRVCVSYDTPIAMLTPDKKFVRLWNGYSKTSMGHLSTWCIANGVPFVNGKTWDRISVGRKYCMESVEKMAKG